MSELEKVKIILDIVDYDEFDEYLELLLNQAEDIINTIAKFPSDYDYLKIEATAAAFNQRGAEGAKGSSGGVTQTWAYPFMSQFIKENMPNKYLVL